MHTAHGVVYLASAEFTRNFDVTKTIEIARSAQHPARSAMNIARILVSEQFKRNAGRHWRIAAAPIHLGGAGRHQR